MKKLMLLAALCFLPGCVVSFHPFYADTSVVPLPELAGRWDHDDSSYERLEFAEGSEVTFFESQIGKSAPPAGVRYKAVYFKVGDAVFSDVWPLESSSALNIPVHFMYRIRLQGDRLELTPMDYDWISQEIRTGRVTLPHISRMLDDGNGGGPEEQILFTATPAEWAQFLTQFKDEKELFSQADSETYIKSKAPHKSDQAPPGKVR